MPVIEKCDCVRTCAENNGYRIMKYFNGQKLSDGKTIGGAGRLTDTVINLLQNYFRDAIRWNKGDLTQMMKSV